MPTTRIPRDFKEFLKSLDAHNARFLLIGGYAVNAYGYVRNTVDMDIWIASDRTTCEGSSRPFAISGSLPRRTIFSTRAMRWSGWAAAAAY